jgi:hypothetical protein
MARQYKTPELQRRSARKMRAMVRSGKSVAYAVEHHQVSRAYYYILVAQLDAWENEVTREEQIAELDADIDAKLPGATFATFPSQKWFLPGGQLILDYIRGEYNVDLAVKPKAAKRDPLLD